MTVAAGTAAGNSPAGIVPAAGWQTDKSEGMKPPSDPHYRHRLSAEIISHAVWLYYMFGLSFACVTLSCFWLSEALSPSSPSVGTSPDDVDRVKLPLTGVPSRLRAACGYLR
jgi:hypothetical protein